MDITFIPRRTKEYTTMATITFICFSRNDELYEQKRVSLCMESLLRQTNKDFTILFYDFSTPGTEFVLPNSDLLTIHKCPMPIGQDWRPAHARNVGALEASTSLLAQINTDIIFSKNFCQVLLDKQPGYGRLVLCERRNLSEDQFLNIKKLEDVDAIAKKIKLHDRNTCGDMQCMSRDNFLSVGGYHGLIKNGVAERGDWISQAYGEDEPMVSTLESKGIGVNWIGQDEAWMVHLWHRHRLNARIHCKSRYGGTVDSYPEDRP